MSRLLRRHKKPSHGSGIPEITLTPLIDTCLTLLIIFMVTSPMINNSIKVDLPKGRAQEAQGLQEDLVVHIANEATKKNELKIAFYLNGTAIQREQIIPQLKKKIGNQKNKTVFVKGDKTIGYGQVLELVDEIKTVGGIDRVALATARLA